MRPTRQEVAKLFGCNLRDVEMWQDGSGELSLTDCDVEFGFAHLEQLASIVGTRHINFRCSSGEPDYSEWTPGSPGNAYIVWGPRTQGAAKP
jgi:hypothetical protein